MQEFQFYKSLSDGSKQLIQKYIKTVNIPKGMELFSQGDICFDILFLVKGTVRVYRIHDNGQEITLYYLENGEQCNVNLNSAFTKTPAIGTAMAQSDLTGYMLPANIVKELYTKEPAYQQFIFSLFALRLESMAVLVEDVRFKKLDERLTDWLTHQNKKMINITHEELASHLGTSREVISRLLKEFEHHNIIKLHRKIIEII